MLAMNRIVDYECVFADLGSDADKKKEALKF